MTLSQTLVSVRPAARELVSGCRANMSSAGTGHFLQMCCELVSVGPSDRSAMRVLSRLVRVVMLVKAGWVKGSRAMLRVVHCSSQPDVRRIVRLSLPPRQDPVLVPLTTFPDLLGDMWVRSS